MTIRRARLVDGTRELVLLDRAAFRMDLILTKLDIPSPAVRAVAESRTDADGEDDYTSHHGARAVSAEVELFDTPAALIDELNSYLHPRRRPYLVIVDDEWGQERRLLLRPDQWSSPIDPNGHRRRTVPLQWRNPDGVWEAAQPISAIVNADAGQATGRRYTFKFPRAYPATLSVGAYELTNPGNSWADQRVRLYGPAVGPRWTNDLTGETLTFTSDLALSAGEYLELDTRAHTAYLNSDTSLTRLHLLDFEVSTWWQLAPGRNRVRYHPSAGTGIGAVADLTYRPTWL